MWFWFWIVYAVVLVTSLSIVPKKAYSKAHGDPLDATFNAALYCFIWPAVAVGFAVIALILAFVWCTIPEFRKEHPLQLPWKT